MRIVLVLLIAVALSGVANSAVTGTVSGTLVTSEGKPAANQKIRFRKVVGRAPIGRDSLGRDALTAATATTDKDGKFSQSLEAGDYWAEAGSKTLGYARERVEVKAGESAEIKLVLTKDDVPK